MQSIISCPDCSRKLRVPDDLLGKEVKCPTCGITFTAPAGEGGAPAPPPPKEEEAPPRPSSRGRAEPPPEADYDERPPSKSRPSRRRDDEEDEDDYDEDRLVRRRRRDEKPGKVQAIAIMTLVGGILAIVLAVGWLAYIGLVGLATLGVGLLCCLWPGPYYSLVLGIMATIKGAQLLGKDGHLQPPPKGISIMMIINIVNGDVVNLVLGILNLVFLNDEEVARYYRG